jgi:hypothetical protein
MSQGPLFLLGSMGVVCQSTMLNFMSYPTSNWHTLRAATRGGCGRRLFQCAAAACAVRRPGSGNAAARSAPPPMFSNMEACVLAVALSALLHYLIPDVEPRKPPPRIEMPVAGRVAHKVEHRALTHHPHRPQQKQRPLAHKAKTPRGRCFCWGRWGWCVRARCSTL